MHKRRTAISVCIGKHDTIIVRNRLTFAAQFIDDGRRLADVLRPGRLIIVDLRDECIEKEEALGLFVVILNIFANAGRDAGFNKLIVFDVAHKYVDNPSLTRHGDRIMATLPYAETDLDLAWHEGCMVP
jgi:hypothetical protein